MSIRAGWAIRQKVRSLSAGVGTLAGVLFGALYDYSGLLYNHSQGNTVFGSTVCVTGSGDWGPSRTFDGFKLHAGGC
jgi:hypothetical protein